MKKTAKFVAALTALLVVVGAAGYAYLQWAQRDALPAGIAAGNGRIEATEIDIATKFAGKLASVEVAEGDYVTEGQMLARIDTAQVEAQLRAAEAQIKEAEQARDSANFGLSQRQSELALAEKDLERQLVLLGKGFVSDQRVDSQRLVRDSARAALSAAESGLRSAEAAIESATAARDQITDMLSNATLLAPKDGRVLYRLAEPGEVLGAGGKVLTLLDLSDVYMTIFLPSADAARTAIGAEGRILLDVLPDRAVPGTVSFVSPQAQYTPKQVETRSERDRLMFRVKISAPKPLVAQYLQQVKTGVTGVGYVKLDPAVTWPSWLESDLTTGAATDAKP
ncbi:HlyD family secretion protein [Ciceribacter azotifigens]|uniref:HlyD family secretion protein n=1 Tax=Ciceribacter azotifigens TaxID=2069303 RepID=UPI003A895D8F